MVTIFTSVNINSCFLAIH